MECLKKPIWNNYTKQEIEDLVIEKPDEKIRYQVLQNWDHIAKPLDGLGEFEKIIAQIGAMTGSDQIELSKKAVIMMCADNGVVAEGISQSGQEVTTGVAEKMGTKESSVCKMAKVIGADTIPVDIGINNEEEIPGLLPRKIRLGTRNFAKEPAMTEEEMVRAICTGIDIVYDCKKAGYHILATGEMGIGNTTTSSAVAAALFQCEVEEVTGRGAGLDDKRLLHKKEVIRNAIEKYDLKHADPFRILQTVGGLDIAGLTGVCIGGALFHIPIVLDGVISMAAALLAERIKPGTKGYMIASHKGKEPAIKKFTDELELTPVIDAKLALGEGTGAVMMLSLLETALSIYSDRIAFSDIRTEQYERF